MARMTLGTYLFDRNPSIYSQPDLMTPRRHTASVETYTSMAFFSWGVSIVGKEISLRWDYLQESQYNALLALFTADAAVVFNPNTGDGKTYTVEITDLTAKFHYRLKGTGSEDVWRSKITLDLLILNEVVA